MQYYDWQHLTKPFSVTPVVQDTVENTKALSLTPVGQVKQNSTYIRLPATIFTSYVTFSVPVIVAQFNYSVGGVLSITNPLDTLLDTATGSFTNVCLVLRWRVGSTVYRYALSKTFPSSMHRWLIPCDTYGAQIFGGNFVIEVWQTSAGTVSLNKDLYLDTGRVYVQSSYDDNGNIINPLQIVTLSQLQTALPATVDNYDVAGNWLSN